MRSDFSSNNILRKKNGTCFCCPCLINVLVQSPLRPYFNFPCCVASHQFLSTKMILFVTQLPSLERWALLPFSGFPTLTCFLFFRTCYILGTSSCIVFFYPYWYSYIAYFVCDSASEFGAMGSTSFEPYQFCFLHTTHNYTVIRNSKFIVHLY